jgi:molecular chaperone DnaK
MERVYAAKAAAEGGAPGAEAPGAGAGSKDGDVVDAEFTEVKDKK